MTILKKNNTIFEPFFGPFSPNLGKSGFSLKKGLCQFLNIPISTIDQKSEKKIMIHS